MSAADAAAEIGDDAVARITAGTGSISGTITKLIDYQADVPLERRHRDGTHVRRAHRRSVASPRNRDKRCRRLLHAHRAQHRLVCRARQAHRFGLEAAARLLPERRVRVAGGRRFSVTDGQDTPSIDEMLEPILSGYIAGASRYATSAAISAEFAPECRLRLHRLRCELPRRTQRRPRRRDLRRAAPARRADRDPGGRSPTQLARLNPVEHRHRRRYRRRLERGADEAVAARPGCGRLAARRSRPLRRPRARSSATRSKRREFVWVATGANFPDALAASNAAAAYGEPGPDRSWHRVVARRGDAWPRIAARNPAVVAIAGGTGVVIDGDRSNQLWKSCHRQRCRAAGRQPLRHLARHQHVRLGRAGRPRPRRCTPS